MKKLIRWLAKISGVENDIRVDELNGLFKRGLNDTWQVPKDIFFPGTNESPKLIYRDVINPRIKELKNVH